MGESDITLKKTAKLKTKFLDTHTHFSYLELTSHSAISFQFIEKIAWSCAQAGITSQSYLQTFKSPIILRSEHLFNVRCKSMQSHTTNLAFLCMCYVLALF